MVPWTKMVVLDWDPYAGGKGTYTQGRKDDGDGYTYDIWNINPVPGASGNLDFLGIPYVLYTEHPELKIKTN